MRNTKNSDGFSVLQTLLVLIIVGIVGFTGWYIWSANHNANKNLDQAIKSANTQPATTSKKPSTQTQAEVKYLDIKEFGVKLPLSSNIEDAYYVVSTSSESDGQPNTIWLGLKSLDNTACAAALANSGGDYPIGAIIKAKSGDTDPVSGASIQQTHPNGTTINGYYYAYNSGVTGTSDDRCVTKANITNAAAIDEGFTTASKNIVSE